MLDELFGWLLVHEHTRFAPWSPDWSGGILLGGEAVSHLPRVIGACEQRARANDAGMIDCAQSLRCGDECPKVVHIHMQAFAAPSTELRQGV